MAQFLKKLSIFLKREKFQSDLREEMAFHREQAARDFQADGMSEQSAREAAQRQFGNQTQIQERSHDVVALGFETTLQDLRFALRELRMNPGFAATAIVILALAIAASVTMFGFVDAALIQPLPYRDPGHLVGVFESVAMIPRANLSYFDYLDWKKRNDVFSSFDVWNGTGYLLGTATGVEPASGTRVSAGFFRTLGVTPILGRDFVDGEDQPSARRTVLLSYAAWRKWFGGKANVIGQSVTLSGAAYTMIGVLPRDFQFAPRGRADFWTSVDGSTPCEKRRGCHNLYGLARLKDGVSVPAALAEMKSIAKQLESEYPTTNRDQSAAVEPLTEVIVGDVRPLLLLLLSGAAMLLLIACVNVTSLLLARSEQRKREIAVRGALGASFVRLIRQFATEGVVLVAIGCALGLFSARWSMQLLTALIPKSMLAGMPYLDGLGLNFRVVAFACGVSLLAALLFAIAPVFRVSRLDIRDALAEAGRAPTGHMWRRLGANLVVVELALAVVLLSGAGLLGKSFYRLLHVDLGFQPDHLATLQMAAPGANYQEDQQRITLARQVVDRLSALPGVKSVGISSVMPVSFNGNTDWIRFVGKPYHGEHNEVNGRDVSAGYFTTLQAKLLRGRFFTDAEEESKPRVVIINEALAKRYFGDEDPIGKKFGDITLSADSIKEIIGVVDDIKEGSLDSDVWPAEYLPFNQSPDPFFDVVARTSQAEQSVLPTMRAAIREIDSNLGVINEASMSDRIADSPSAYMHRSSAWLVGGFAGLALVLGLVGLYGVISYSVSQRTREIGVRVALGASRNCVCRMVLKEAGVLIVVGLVIGITSGIFAASFMGKLLFGVESWDLATLSAVGLLLTFCAFLAAYVPARRAASLDPVEALRLD